MRSVFAPALSLCLAACSEPSSTPPADAPPAAGTGAMGARSIRWGAETLEHPRMTHSQVAAGGTLTFDLVRP